MAPRTVRGDLIHECQFCGAIEGAATAVNEVYVEREALKRGMDPEVFALVQVLEKIPGLKVREAGGGSCPDRIPPYVYFHVEEKPGILREIERILQSLEMSHRRTHLIWAIEAHHLNGELRFALRPRFMKPVQDLDPEEIREAQEDLRLLAERLERDMALSWWS